MSDYFPIFVYLGIVAVVTIIIVALSGLVSSKKKSPVKFMPYESGIQTETHLLLKRFPLRHYLVALIFLIFDIEIIFMYPWAVIAKQIGPFAFYEMLFFLVVLFVGYLYVWRKRGLQWE